MGQDDIRIRVAVESDAPALLAIYAPYVTDTAITFEYDVPTVEDFAGRIMRFGATHPFLVAERAGAGGAPEVLGYAYAHPYYGYAAYAWCAELTIYLRRDVRGMGLGTRLYDALEAACKDMGILTAYACITRASTSDDPHVPPTSVLFHEARGYSVIGEFAQCGYKFDRWYDTVWMEKNLAPHSGAPRAVKPFAGLAGGPAD